MIKIVKKMNIGRNGASLLKMGCLNSSLCCYGWNEGKNENVNNYPYSSNFISFLSFSFIPTKQSNSFKSILLHIPIIIFCAKLATPSSCQWYQHLLRYVISTLFITKQTIKQLTETEEI